MYYNSSFFLFTSFLHPVTVSFAWSEIVLGCQGELETDSVIYVMPSQLL